MRSKEMETLAAFNVIDEKRAAAEQEKETSISLQKDSDSQNKRQSHPSELSEN